MGLQLPNTAEVGGAGTYREPAAKSVCDGGIVNRTYRRTVCSGASTR